MDCKEPDHRSKCLVIGFIRAHSRREVPDALSDICLSFFYDYADCWEFGCITSPLRISAFNKRIRHKGQHVALESVILTRKLTSGHYFWRFRYEIKNKWWTRKVFDSIAIIRSSQIKHLRSGKFPSVFGYGFAYHHGCLIDNSVHGEFEFGMLVCDWNSRKYARPVQDKDEIEMHLDMDKLELSYAINGKNFGKAFDIEPNEYQAVVTMAVPDESWTLEESNFISYL